MSQFEVSYKQFKDEYMSANDTYNKIAAIYRFVSRYPQYNVIGKYVKWNKDQLKKTIGNSDIELRAYIKSGIDTTTKNGKRQVSLACIAEACILREADPDHLEEHLIVACLKILADNTSRESGIMSVQDIEQAISAACETTQKPIPYYKTRSMKPDCERISEDKVRYRVADGQVKMKYRTTYKKITSREEFITYLDMSKSYTDNVKRAKLLYGVSKKLIDKYIKKFDIKFEVSGNKKPKKSIEQIQDKWKISKEDWSLPLDKLYDLVCDNTKQDKIPSRTTVYLWKKRFTEEENDKIMKLYGNKCIN